jgi:hypothetical protein
VTPAGQEVPIEWIGNLAPIDVLYEFDGPQTFTCSNSTGDLLLVHLCERVQDRSRFIVVPTDASTVTALNSGKMATLESLRKPWTWVVEQNLDEEVIAVWRVEPTDLPEDFWPRPGAYLCPQGIPLVNVKMTGPELTAERVTASVMKRMMDGVSGAFKTLLELSIERLNIQDGVTVPMRRLYDPPIAKLAFNSLEVSFGEPDISDRRTQIANGEDPVAALQETAFAQMGLLLRGGLDWLQAPADTQREANSEWRATVEALEKLVPPLRGTINQVEISGRLVGKPIGRGYHLDRAASRRVKTESGRVAAGHVPFSGQGHVGECDRDRLSFILRDRDSKLVANCTFDEELFDDVVAAFQSESEYLVVGHKSLVNQVVTVTSIGETTAG